MDEIGEGAAGVDRHIARAVDAQRGLPGGRPAQAEDAWRVAAGNRRHERPVDGQRQAAGRRQRGIDGGRQRRRSGSGVGLGDQERPEAADVADLGRGFAEAAQVGRGLRQGRVVRIGRACRRGQSGCRRSTFQAAVGNVLGCSEDSCAAQSMVWPGSIWLTSTGIASPLTVSLDKRVNVSWPLSPGRRMPAGPLGATARTWADCM